MVQQVADSVKDELPKEQLTLDFGAIFRVVKKHYIIIILLFLMGIGFWLRSYHMDFPVIGYHNMKENQYIPYTEFMYYADDFLDYFRTETYWIGTQEHGYFTQYEFPLIPWIILLLWKLVGIKLWAARLVIILFSIGSIPLLYLVGKKITQHNSLILVACTFYTIMPISVFFGRNVQPEAPGLFFVLLGTYYFFSWQEEYTKDKNKSKHNWKYFLFFSISFLITILLKIPNGIGLIPLLFFVPYKKLFSEKKPAFQLVLVFVLIMALFPIWVQLSHILMPHAATVGTGNFGESFIEVYHNMLRVFTYNYWHDAYPALRAFSLDNFTSWFLFLSFIGFVFGFVKRKTHLGKFLTGSFISLLLYIIVFADKIRGHAYYHYIFLPFVCFASAYALYVIAHTFVAPFISLLARFFSKETNKDIIHLYLFIIFVAVFLFFSWSSIQDATNRVFDTIFYGEDVAGQFIYENSVTQDRVFIDGVFSQSVGILWHAHRFGTDEITSNLTWFNELEDSLHFRWVVLYGAGMQTIQTKQEVWEYIQQSYAIRHIGFIIHNNQYIPYYIVLEKSVNPDNVFDPTAFTAGKQAYLAQTYTTSHGVFELYAIDDIH